jgi:uncharacterized membrane protein (DUF4010 family)
MTIPTLNWEGMPDFDSVARLTIAALVGLAVGTEREWSGHAAGPDARFAGLRTFLLLGLLGGASGLLAAHGDTASGAVLLGGGALLTTAAYVMAVHRNGAALDGTTEAAALVVLALGVLAGAGQLALAAGAGTVVVVALREKERLHGAVRHIGDVEMRAALQFAVLALVVLPLLPDAPLEGLGGIRIRALWTVVLLFSAVDFAGYVARRALGARRGYGATGVLGGVVSSTLVTIQFSRLSKRTPAHSVSLALGSIAACSVMPVRVAVLTAVLSAAVGAAVVPYLVAPALVGAAVIGLVWKREPADKEPTLDAEASNPLRLGSAIRMAVIFQVAILAIAAAQSAWGSAGVAGSAVGLGMFDVDALTVAMTRTAAGTIPVAIAAQGIAIGVLTNTVVKLAIGLLFGSPAFRRVFAIGLGLQAMACAAGLWWMRA